MLNDIVDHRQDIVLKPKSGKKPFFQPLSPMDLRDSHSYLLAYEALKGTTVADFCFGLRFVMKSSFDVECAIATIDGIVKRLCERYVSDVPDPVRRRYSVLVDKANAYTMALDDFTSPVEEGS